MGQSKTPECFSGFWCDLLTKIENFGEGWWAAQNFIAPAAYWNEPSPKGYSDMLSHSVFLPYINNLKPHSKYDQYK